MKLASILAVALGLAGSANAHMRMDNPTPINHPNNKFSNSPDYDYVAPLGAKPYPCRGQLVHLGGDAGRPVATWGAGSEQTISIGGGALHNGGSCQFSLSYDRGNTFRVIKSVIGGCPREKNYRVRIPNEAPNGERVVFAWSWFNNTGNREMYMNCAVVKIQGSRGGNFNSRPLIAKANIPGAMTTPVGDYNYPQPGPDVQRGQSGGGNTGFLNGPPAGPQQSGNGGGSAPRGGNNNHPAPARNGGSCNSCVITNNGCYGRCGGNGGCIVNCNNTFSRCMQSCRP